MDVDNLKSRKPGIWRGLAVGALCVGILVLWFRPSASQSVASEGMLPFLRMGSPAPAGRYANLRHLMQSGLHEEYTYLSFTIWHDPPLTSEKMDSIASSSTRIARMAEDLKTYRYDYKKFDWNQTEEEFFQGKALQLSQVAQRLGDAAQKHDENNTVNFFLHLDSTCQGCHSRYRPDLVNK